MILFLPPVLAFVNDWALNTNNQPVGWLFLVSSAAHGLSSYPVVGLNKSSATRKEKRGWYHFTFFTLGFSTGIKEGLPNSEQNQWNTHIMWIDTHPHVHTHHTQTHTHTHARMHARTHAQHISQLIQFKNRLGWSVRHQNVIVRHNSELDILVIWSVLLLFCTEYI